MPAIRKLLKITETKTNISDKFFLDHFENVLGWNVDNVYPGYERHNQVIADIMRLPISTAPEFTDWGQEDGHHEHSVDGEECEHVCICGTDFKIGSYEELQITHNVKFSEAFPVEIADDNELYLMRKAYNEEHGIEEKIEIVSVDEHWEVINAS